MDLFRPLSRRQVLLGATGTVLLAACAKKESGDDAGSGSSTSSTLPGASSGGLVLFKAFQLKQPVGVDLRLPLALADSEGSFDVDLPRTISVRLRGPDGTVGAPMAIDRHDQDLPRGYFPLRTKFDAQGRWTIVAEAGKTQVETTVDVAAASELPAIPAPGDPLPKIPTPTRKDHQGVNPICTATPACPFHSVSLDDAIGAGNPIVLLVSTPAYCQVAICGPVLDLLVKRQAHFEQAGLTVIHAEVYVDRQAQQTSPTVDALGLDFEPSLFLAAPDGTVTDRLDSIFDGNELDEALARLVP
ncbi:MAG: hypothetical protein JWN67_1925 [Actinomycetia bacterium]|nr:hypothetical protein [Actinomycetes bacterium]